MKLANKLLAAAEETFINHGLVNSTIDEICAKAKVSKPTFYKLFKDKDELFIGYAQYKTALVVDDLEKIASQVVDLKSFVAQAEVYLKYMAREDIQIFNNFVAARAQIDPKVLEVRKAFLMKKFQMRQRVVTQLIIAGLIAPTRNIDVITMLLASLVTVDPLVCVACYEKGKEHKIDFKKYAEDRCKIFLSAANEFYATELKK